MTEDELEGTFDACYQEHKKNLDLDYVRKFMHRATNGLFNKYGQEEVASVLQNGKNNQNLHNDLRWILEVGSLMNIFQFKLESSDLKSVQRNLISILYEMNKCFARELVSKKVLPAGCNILYSYSDLAEILEGSQQIYLKFCCDPVTQKLKDNAKNQLFANYFDVMTKLLV